MGIYTFTSIRYNVKENIPHITYNYVFKYLHNFPKAKYNNKLVNLYGFSIRILSAIRFLLFISKSILTCVRNSSRFIDNSIAKLIIRSSYKRQHFSLLDFNVGVLVPQNHLIKQNAKNSMKKEKQLLEIVMNFLKDDRTYTNIKTKKKAYNL